MREERQESNFVRFWAVSTGLPGLRKSGAMLSMPSAFLILPLPLVGVAARALWEVWKGGLGLRYRVSYLRNVSCSSGTSRYLYTKRGRRG